MKGSTRCAYKIIRRKNAHGRIYKQQLIGSGRARDSGFFRFANASKASFHWLVKCIGDISVKTNKWHKESKLIRPAFCSERKWRDHLKMDVQAEKRSIYKNVGIISVAFMILFTAFQSMASLQSSINKVRYGDQS